MFVNLPYRLAALRSVTAARVQAMYQAIADVVNGQIDGRNFSRRARIPNELKAAPYGVFGVSLSSPSRWRMETDVGNGLPAAAGLPVCLLRIPSGAGEMGDLDLVAWSAAFATTLEPVELQPAGSIKQGQATLRQNGAAVDAVAIPDGTAGGVVASRVLAVPRTVRPGDVLQVSLDTVLYNAPAGAGSRLTATVWLKAKHVR